MCGLMRSPKADKGQIYTMEGVTAALIMLAVLLFIIQANSLTHPQTEKAIDMKLGQIANDVITTVDWNSADAWSVNSSLKSYVAGWDGHSVTYASNTPDPGLAGLNDSITAMLREFNPASADIKYNIEFSYDVHYKINGTSVKHDEMAIINGEPGDNSMVSKRLITLNDNDTLSDYWTDYQNNGDQFPQVVEVRITCWYL